MRRSRPIAGWKACAVLGAITFASHSAGAQESPRFHYCMLAKHPYGEPVFYSAVFRAADDVMVQGIESAFDSYVAARLDPDAMSGALCFGPFETYQEAADRENDAISNSRRNGKGVVVTRWAYRGD